MLLTGLFDCVSELSLAAIREVNFLLGTSSSLWRAALQANDYLTGRTVQSAGKWRQGDRSLLVKVHFKYVFLLLGLSELPT